MNYIIILAMGILLKRTLKFKKIFLSAVIGTIPTIFLFIDISKIYLLITTIIFAIIMSLLSYGFKSILYTLKNIAYMYLISIFLAGSLYLINTYFVIENIFFNMIILLIISSIITWIYLKILTDLKNSNSNYYRIDIYLKDKPKIILNAYLDTGNMLNDPYSHKPIILVPKDLIDATNEKIIFVPYHTINNNGFLKCFSPQKIYIDKIGYRKRVLIGLIDKLTIDNADCILNQKLLERI